MGKIIKNKYQYAVLGLGRWGSSLAKELYKNDCEVLVVDNNEEKINAIGEYCTHSLVGDLADDSVIKAIGVDTFDTVIIAIGENMQASIICALTCKELGAKFIIAKANNEKHAKILKKIGIDKVIIPEDDSALKAAKTLMHPNVTELMESEKGYSIAEFIVPTNWIGKTLVDIKIRQKFNLNILLLTDKDGKNTIPYGELVFSEGDLVTMGGLAADVNNFIGKI
jgi:trk system potassium uptake protein TrkA